MSQIPRLMQAMNEPLLIRPSVGKGLVHLLARKLFAGAQLDGATLHAELGIPMPEERKPAAEPARIAVIPVYGVVAQHAMSMGASTADIGAQFDRAMARADVDAILLDVDSPGGTVSGVPELAAKIYAGRGTKPIVAIANSLAASAAYWIAAAADQVWVTPSGETGSIGVYTTHEDWSEAMEKMGVKVTSISRGKYKLEGAPWEPLTDEAKAAIEERVDEVYGWFTKDVATFRGATPAQVRSGYGEARVLGAKQSVAANLADKVGTFEDVVAMLAKKVARKPRGSRAVVEREKLALDISG